MKVMCIDNKGNPDKGCIGDWIPEEGKTYTVISEFEKYGQMWYVLAEDKGGNGWNPKYFIPVDRNKFDTILAAVIKVPKKRAAKILGLKPSALIASKGELNTTIIERA